MKSTIRLFKAVPITAKRNKKLTDQLLKATIPKGFIFSPDVVGNYPGKKLIDLIYMVEEELGLTSEQMNSTFHKSWNKIKSASMEQLVMEQIIHYFTTYGFESLGIYSEDSVYIPNEKLEIPELKEDITLVVIKGYTKAELKAKIAKLLETGIALAKETMEDVVDVINFVGGFSAEEVDSFKNKEVKMMLYDHLKIVPESPVEFLRYAVYKTINSTLLIKDGKTLTELKANVGPTELFVRYNKAYGLKRLGEIFNRFKPIFLAFRTTEPKDTGMMVRNAQLRAIINKIRRYAKKYHKAMPADFLNDVTGKIKRGETVDTKILAKELDRVNIFRKIRLAYALKYRTNSDVDSILYKIRNGKGYAKAFDFANESVARKILATVVDSIVKDIKPKVEGKKIYIPEHIEYSLPATEKQFTGDFPSGTYVKVPKDIIAGVHWTNQPGKRVDLDLSLINCTDGKIGWDSCYRNDGGSVLFSGDITDAPAPKGATELFYIRQQKLGSWIMFLNYYNYDKDKEVPYNIMVGQEQVSNLKQNYMIDPNNVKCICKTKIDVKQKVIGLLVATTNGCRFYFTEAELGNSITSREDKEYVEQTRKYLFNFYKNMISLKDVLKKAGAELVEEVNEKTDVDLSPETLEKDKIISLLT